MTVEQFQQWLNAKGQSIVVDGQFGPVTRLAMVEAFTNRDAPAITDSQITAFANRLGCTPKQLRAVAKVESAGNAFDGNGRPKILYERHIFNRLTEGAYGLTAYSDPNPGGYSLDSWVKLGLAAAKEVMAALASCSWGKFQVMGYHASSLGYDSPLALAYSCVQSEAAHYDLLARFIEHNGLKEELKKLSANAADCRPFARAYNGPGYEKFSYHSKLAAAMR